MKNKSIPIEWLFVAIVLCLPIFGCIVNSAYGYGMETLSLSCKIYGFVHVTSAIGFIVISLFYKQLLVPFMRTLGMIFMLVALIGFLGMNLQKGYQWLDIISINALNYIEFSLGIFFFLAASILHKYRSLARRIN